MMNFFKFFPLLFFVVCCSVEAQVYKWVGSDGTKNYSDSPPPEVAAKVENKSITYSNDNVALPYSLAQAVQNMPVILYSQDSCLPCSDAKNFLIKNGIPFSEKLIISSEDINKLVQISGSPQLPVVFIGKNKLLGFSNAEWRTTLTQAGYPETNALPANYRYPVPQPLVSTNAELPNVIVQSKPSQPALTNRDPNAFQF